MLMPCNEDKFNELGYSKMKPNHRRRYQNQRRASLGAILNYKDDHHQASEKTFIHTNNFW